MSKDSPAKIVGGASCDDEDAAARLTIAKLLSLGATPTFAVMALLTGLQGGDAMEAHCSHGNGFHLSGMALMYLLMSGFHSPPWLKLFSVRRGAVRRH